jgi:NADPH:quinone reductase-like Zn-dependent oxidoreductase
VHYSSGPRLIVGSDFAGVVEEIGPEVPVGLRKKGERVAGFIHGC